jgi:AAA15 family ATPase/GTPase
MRITKVHIDRFRGFRNQEFEVGSQITAIAGQNGTQKSTLLGIITQTFTISKDNPMSGERPLCGGTYRSAFRDKFRLSPTFDRPKEHEWTLFFDDRDPFQIESIKRSDDSGIRFWQKGNREKGDGYIQFPTIFLSLKRLVPVAEENAIKTDDTLLNDEEIRKFKELHNKILISTTPITSTTGITSTNKQSLGVNTEIYDWNQNSMGQDNIAKIILALFSFQRLKDKYGPSYQGGILAIDELDATMYPASQVELLKVLRKYASDLELQIFYTTHSLSLLEATDELCKETKSRPETFNQVRIIYLKHSDNHVLIKSDVDYNGIALDLNVIAETPHKRKNKITVYVEDKETEIFVKAILKQKLYASLNFVDATFSCSSLIELVNKKVPAFSYPYSIIFLDGDVRKDKANKKKLSAVRNVLLLPGDDSPERMIAKYLYNLSDADLLWNNLSIGYTKQVCFREISFERILVDREDAKKWFNQQLQYWGRGGVKVLNPFLATIQDEVDKFKSDFLQMIKHYIHD